MVLRGINNNGTRILLIPNHALFLVNRMALGTKFKNNIVQFTLSFCKNATTFFGLFFSIYVNGADYG